MNTITARIAALQKQVVALRRHFRHFPELSGCEEKTQDKIISELSAVGIKAHSIAGYGVIADITGNLPGKMIALRADIDALPLTDECEKSYRSAHPGICHACGHDGHIAMLLGLAYYFSGLQGDFPGTIRLLFQPSEEKYPGGAQAMIAEGALSGVSAILGVHLWQPLEVGTVGVSYGRLMASPDEFHLTIQGRGGHGSMPHQTVDALLTAAQIAIALQTIVSRNIDPLEPVALSLGSFHSGEAPNVIPDTAVVSGTVRSFDQQTRDAIFSRIEQIAAGLCQAAGASFQLKKIYSYPPLCNDPAVVKVVHAAASQTLGDINVWEIPPVMSGEDFSYYLQKIPGAFFFVGCGNKTAEIVYPQHHPKFDIDEAALAHGMNVLARAALALLSESGPL